MLSTIILDNPKQDRDLASNLLQSMFSRQIVDAYQEGPSVEGLHFPHAHLMSPVGIVPERQIAYAMDMSEVAGYGQGINDVKFMLPYVPAGALMGKEYFDTLSQTSTWEMSFVRRGADHLTQILAAYRHCHDFSSIRAVCIPNTMFVLYMLHGHPPKFSSGLGSEEGLKLTWGAHREHTTAG